MKPDAIAEQALSQITAGGALAVFVLAVASAAVRVFF